jgi:predicted Rossmann-fold nucleotide-binding protein
MAAVSRAFAEAPARKGLVLGIVPCIAEDSPEVPKRSYPNAWIEVPIRTHLHLSGPEGEHHRSRNHLVALTATVLVALPGGPGTASEVRLALRYKKPLIAYLKAREEIPGLPAEVRSEPDLNQVKAFIAQELARFKSDNKVS